MGVLHGYPLQLQRDTVARFVNKVFILKVLTDGVESGICCEAAGPTVAWLGVSRAGVSSSSFTLSVLFVWELVVPDMLRVIIW